MLLKIDYTKRVFGLDVFRSIAIFIVVLTHGAFLGGDLVNFLNYVPLIDGVELFFVLSGFLIGSILIKQLNSEHFGYKQLFIFLKRRWFRTLPNYYLILVINIILVMTGVISNDINQFNWRFFFFLQNFQEGFIGFFLESWSLCVEEWFYIFAPFLFLVFIQFIKPKQAILLVIIILISLPLFYRFSILGKEVDSFWWDVHFRKVVLTRLDAIGFGVLMAYIKFYYPKLFTNYKVVSFWLGLSIIITLIYIPKIPNEFYAKTIYFSLISIGASLLLPFADSVKKFNFKPWGIFLTHISVLSYSMYLVNLSIISSVFAKYFLPTNHIENLLFFSLYWIFVILLSYLIYRFYEKPMTDLRES